MARILVVCLLVLGFVVAMQGATAIQVTSPSPRDQMRQYLIQQEGAVYNPTFPTRVVTGGFEGQTVQILPLAHAIELQLDAIERLGISFSTPASQSQGTGTDPWNKPEPTWPLVGHILFNENGWKQANATCPTIQPGWPQQARDAWQTAPGDSDRIGFFVSNISEAWLAPGSLAIQNSSIKYWAAHLDPSTANATDYWEYGGGRQEGWTVLAAGLIDERQVQLNTFFCREPTTSSGRVYHHSLVTPFVERIDPKDPQ
jgi:hypothetical protein